MDEKNGKIVKISGKTTCACGDGCNCGCGYNGAARGRSLIWWILGIIVILIVFLIGVKVGEFRVELRNAMSAGGYGREYPMIPAGGYNPGGLPAGVQTN
jgi:hypothetical protein